MAMSMSCWLTDFYPRPPRGGRRLLPWCRMLRTNFYPRPPRGGRPVARADTMDNLSISIHALREEGDHCLRHPRRKAVPISIHALREEGDILSIVSCVRLPNFYPRPPRGGRRPRGARVVVTGRNFYPRPPRGGRRGRQLKKTKKEDISIHALREEGDRSTMPLRFVPCNFYPRPPRGGRRDRRLPDTQGRDFYPRPPRGGRHVSRRETELDKAISIHALREEGDGGSSFLCAGATHFYPRPPRGGRPPAGV